MRFSNFSARRTSRTSTSIMANRVHTKAPWSYQSDFIKWFGPMTSTCYNIDDPEILRASIRAWACVLREKFLEAAPKSEFTMVPLTSMNECAVV